MQIEFSAKILKKLVAESQMSKLQIWLKNNVLLVFNFLLVVDQAVTQYNFLDSQSNPNPNPHPLHKMY